jgi:predicted nucleotidyltransferase
LTSAPLSTFLAASPTARQALAVARTRSIAWYQRMVGPLQSRFESDAERRAVDAEVQRIVPVLASQGATHVVLFGSRATGRAQRGSDVDLLVVMPCPPGESFPARLARVASEIRPRIALDLLVYTPQELERMRHRPFIAEALRQGTELHAS